MKLKIKCVRLLAAGTNTVFASSCYYGPGAQTGTVAGGLIGAGVGTIVGSQSGRPLEGAAVGGAIGAVGGAVLGSAHDNRYRYHHGGYGHRSYGCPPPPCNHRGGYYPSYRGGGYQRY